MTILTLLQQKTELKLVTIRQLDDAINHARVKISQTRGQDEKDVILALTITKQALNEIKQELKEFWGFK